MEQESLHFTNNIGRQKLADAGYVVRSSDSCALLLLEGKFERKKPRRKLEKHDWWPAAMDTEK